MDSSAADVPAMKKKTVSPDGLMTKKKAVSPDCPVMEKKDGPVMQES
jgi:hypothetical protein